GRVGLTADAIAGQIGADLLGDEAAPIPEHDRLIGVRVRWPDAARAQAGPDGQRALERGRLRSPSGQWVPLAGVARLRGRLGAAAEIGRENLRLMVPVTARLEGRDLGSAVAEVQSRLDRIQLPRGYAVEVGGQRLSQREAFRALAAALGAAVALVLLVLVFQF